MSRVFQGSIRTISGAYIGPQNPFLGFVLFGVFTRVADSHSGLLLGGGVGSGDFELNRNYTKRKKPQLAPAPTLSQSKGKRTSSAGQEDNPPV